MSPVIKLKFGGSVLLKPGAVIYSSFKKLSNSSCLRFFQSRSRQRCTGRGRAQRNQRVCFAACGSAKGTRGAILFFLVIHKRRNFDMDFGLR
jgi:hypothetical protein